MKPVAAGWDGERGVRMRVGAWKLVASCLYVCVMAALSPAAAQTQGKIKQKAEQIQSNAAALFKEKKYEKSAEAEEESAKLFEYAERKEGKTCDCAAAAYGTASWLALLAKQPQRALKDAEHAHRLYPDNLKIETNHAHALLFLNKTAEAFKIYLAYKGEIIVGQGTWERVILHDFAELRAAGLDHPQFKAVAQALAEVQKPQKKPGWLGVRVDDLIQKEALALGWKTSRGVKIAEIRSGSPAEKAGLEVGDILVSGDEKDIESRERFLTYVAGRGAGAILKLSVKRAGETLDFNIELAELLPRLSVMRQSAQTETDDGNSQELPKTEIVADANDSVAATAFDASPNGMLLASGGYSQTVKIVEAASGKPLRTVF